MMNITLYAMGALYTLFGSVISLTTKDYVAAAGFCLTGVAAFGFGILSDAIADEKERREKEKGENE